MLSVKGKKKLYNGFTMIEIMVAISIFVIVVLFAGNLFSVSYQLSSRNSNLAELIQNSRVAIDKISRESRQAAELITDISSSTPSHEIMFQDGHDLSQITYIKYFLEDNKLQRENIQYYFSGDPSIFVYYDAVDAFANPPLATSTKQIIGEYFDSMDILNNNGLMNINFNLIKNKTDYTINTDVYIRNW